MDVKFKSELPDGDVHMTMYEFIEHKVKENHERQRIALRKLANNPVFTSEVQALLYQAIDNIDQVEYWRAAYLRLRNKL